MMQKHYFKLHLFQRFYNKKVGNVKNVKNFKTWQEQKYVKTFLDLWHIIYAQALQTLYLLRKKRDFDTELHRANKYEPFRTRTERFRNSCIPHCVSNFRC